jgi:hypothetical protein
MLSKEKALGIVGQLLIVVAGAFIAIKLNESLGRARISPPKKES